MKSLKGKKKLSSNFLLIQSYINFPIHYQPKKYSKDPNDNNKYLLMSSFPNILSKRQEPLSQYAKKKKKNKISLIKKIQRNKIDLLVNNAMDKVNNNIRDYNLQTSSINKMKIKLLPILSKEFIKNDLMNRYNDFLEIKKPLSKSPKKINKEYIWSQKILAQKKLKDYRNLYSLKYLRIDDNDKFNIKNLKSSINIVNNIIEENKKKNRTLYEKNLNNFLTPKRTKK